MNFESAGEVEAAVNGILGKGAMQFMHNGQPLVEGQAPLRFVTLVPRAILLNKERSNGPTEPDAFLEALHRTGYLALRAGGIWRTRELELGSYAIPQLIPVGIHSGEPISQVDIQVPHILFEDINILSYDF